ncbi:MAG: hypothetical protein IJS16_06035 [Butyrivibrio sp.]|nr:hypothetical protein [Butyrivibrio sp.]
MDNSQDKKAWELLQTLSAKENVSKNAIALKLICRGADTCDSLGDSSLDSLAMKIADLVTDKLSATAETVKIIPATNEVLSAEAEKLSAPSPDDEIRTVSKEALSFLDDF